jgi:hypothetical protein
MAGQKDQTRGDTPDMEEAVDDIRDEARRMAGDVKEEAEERAERWSNTLGRRGESLARALHAASDTLRDEGEGGMAELAERAAEQVHRMGRYLEDEDPAGMMDDLEETGRSNPGAFLGVAFAAGVLGGRLLRASSPTNGAAEGEGRIRDLEDRPGVTHPPVSAPTGGSAVTGAPGGTGARSGTTDPGMGSGVGGSRSPSPGRRRGGEESPRRGRSESPPSPQSPRGG